jgi:pimeloyl-ACP methyl ester carboxylesterase
MTRRARAVVALVALMVLAGSAVAAPAAAGGAEPVAACAGRPATVVGTAGDDVIVGTSGDDVIVAGAGDDRVRGRGGDDWVCAGEGADRVSSGPGDDHVLGEPGDDRLGTSDGDDEVDGGPGHDRVRGGRGDDRLGAEAGDDEVEGGPGNDVLDGDAGHDRLEASDGDDTCLGGEVVRGCEATGASVPSFERIDRSADPDHPCARSVPDDPRIECGWLTVLEDRDRPDGALVRLPVVIIRSASPTPAPDPIVHFEGGPGYGGTDRAESFLEADLGGRRDVILLDQRGTGSAQPDLDCPEVDEAIWATFAEARPADEEHGLMARAYAACRARLVAAGVDLDQYDSGTSAADIADLRRALGISSWNLFGVSYGTTLALATMRAHPEGVRSVAIDSVYPLTVGGGPESVVASAERAFATLYAGCAADPACDSAFPDLEQAVADVVAAYNADPHESVITDPLTGRRRPIAITGNDIIAGLFQALYDASLIPLVPSIVEQLRARQTGIIDVFVQEAVPGVVEGHEALTLSVECSDRAAFPEDYAEAVAEHPEYAGLVSPSVCEAWAVEAASSGFNDPVTSEIPTLVLAGEYDPITPPADSRDAAEALGNATYVEFPGIGHGAVRSHPCPDAIFDAFLDAPGAPLDTSCAPTTGPPAWVTPAAVAG